MFNPIEAIRRYSRRRHWRKIWLFTFKEGMRQGCPVRHAIAQADDASEAYMTRFYPDGRANAKDVTP